MNVMAQTIIRLSPRADHDTPLAQTILLLHLAPAPISQSGRYSGFILKLCSNINRAWHQTTAVVNQHNRQLLFLSAVVTRVRQLEPVVNNNHMLCSLLLVLTTDYSD